ncbi:hypothetical protein BcDW1_3530 [Botrytis cinerea BcDW1]|uniref:Uncharacterized protein n=1 Tax=Botryotinia fuckeliana (strain BcDW1) TaxID=1290391 RepID=M7ULV5_BOTF1|nr:hypothetical protein BcDW1_3530 [Botrytis cinerea BcDW1]
MQLVAFKMYRTGLDTLLFVGYIIRRSSKARFKDPLYLFNSIGMLIPYCAVIALNFIFRFANYENGECRIGMKQVAMIPLIVGDLSPILPNSLRYARGARLLTFGRLSIYWSIPRSISGDFGFSNRDNLFTDTNAVHGATPDDYSYARDAIDLPTVTTTVTAGVGMGDMMDEEEGGKNRGLENRNRETGLRKPKMAITVERDHVREVIETGIRIVNDRDHERLILTLPRGISGGGGSIGIEIGGEEREGGDVKMGEGDDTDISF